MRVQVEQGFLEEMKIELTVIKMSALVRWRTGGCGREEVTANRSAAVVPTLARASEFTRRLDTAQVDSLPLPQP